MPRKNKHVIVIDLDDTLIETSDSYWTARERFLDLIQSELSQTTDRDALTAEFEKIDNEKINSHGLGVNRYLLTMLEMVNTYNIQTHNTSDKINEIIRNLTTPPKCREGMNEFLDFCRKEFRTILLTRGEESIQIKKIEYHKLKEKFDEIIIVNQKNESVFMKIKLDHENISDSFVSIGDSIRFDINPAISVGYIGIWVKIPHHSYSWTHDQAVSSGTGFHTASSLKDVEDKLKFVLNI